uniref:uncharacterized protein LOC108594147 isoform X2 n=1 Tax=Callithrix jacchus TaxID=9483 RepID=UPI0023DD0246|nr:uncharacterized protein LOC108594147 isoform X2 [Callithrix jacchus]
MLLSYLHFHIWQKLSRLHTHKKDGFSFWPGRSIQRCCKLLVKGFLPVAEAGVQWLYLDSLEPSPLGLKKFFHLSILSSLDYRPLPTDVSKDRHLCFRAQMLHFPRPPWSTIPPFCPYKNPRTWREQTQWMDIKRNTLAEEHTDRCHRSSMVERCGHRRKFTQDSGRRSWPLNNRIPGEGHLPTPPCFWLLSIF